ncbi:MAG: ABC transporter ATP-binding protein [Caulobacteraceae bacterium]|nr:ABC transporter ATP-binding protein [Caulobacteraceae bacterium]
MDQAQVSTFRVVLRLVRQFMLPRWPMLAIGTACAGGAALLTGLLAALLQPAVNGLLASQADLSTLGRLPLILAGLAVGRGVAQVAQGMIANRMGIDLVNSVQIELMGKLMHSDLARLRAAHSGSFLSKLLNDTMTIREAATTGLLNYLQSGLTIVALLAVMFSKDWLLTLFVLLGGPIVAWVLRVFSVGVMKALKGTMDVNAALATTILESLDGVRVIKMEGREDYETGRLAHVLATRRRVMLKGADAQAAAAPISEVMSMVMVAGVIAYFGWRVHMTSAHLGILSIKGMTVGGFTAFLVALMAAGQSLRQFASLQTTMAMGLAGARGLFAALDVRPQICDGPTARALPQGGGTVRLENVTFSYGAELPVLNDLSLEARRGEIVALVGPSGGGKTTILALIPRFYDVNGGQVTIDDHDIRDLTLASLRSHIALVTQEPFLFDDTIGANIAYAKPGAGQAEIEAAARQAAAHEFILDLPNRYETRVGEAGLRLSGGQRQRIAIARAFLKNAPILLLDEATSALDTESEAQVQAALERLMSGRTTILIAHRLSTVRGADRIYVIDRGRIVETGSHSDLVRCGGLYSRLAGAQDLDRAPEPV